MPQSCELLGDCSTQMCPDLAQDALSRTSQPWRDEDLTQQRPILILFEMHQPRGPRFLTPTGNASRYLRKVPEIAKTRQHEGILGTETPSPLTT